MGRGLRAEAADDRSGALLCALTSHSYEVADTGETEFLWDSMLLMKLKVEGEEWIIRAEETPVPVTIEKGRFTRKIYPDRWSVRVTRNLDPVYILSYRGGKLSLTSP